MSIITAISSRLFPSEVMRLINRAAKFTRYQPVNFVYQGMNFEATDFLSVAWQLKEIFEDEELRFNSLSDVPVIYDCGANVGVASIYLKKLYPGSVIKAFEPDPKVFACLEKNLKMNNISGVQLFRKAVWIEDGKLQFSSEGADGGSLVSGGGNKIEVESIRLKDLMSKETNIDFLKIDIEGAEVEVMNDIRDELPKVKNLFVEYHSWIGKPQGLDQLCSVLSENGFRYYIRSINSSVKNPFISKMDSSGMDLQLNIHAIRNQGT